MQMLCAKTAQLLKIRIRTILTMARLHPGAKKPALVKGLLICCTFTLLLSVAFGVWASLTSDYSTVLNYDDIVLIQLDPPQEGDPVATMHTDLGDMTYLLYPEECPETVKSFTALAEQGYYDGTYIFRVEQDIFFSGGSKNPDGFLSDEDAKLPQEHIPQELSAKLWPLRGALCALETGSEGGFWKTLTKTREAFTGSRFLVANSIEITDEIREGLTSDGNDAMQRVGQAFADYGGIPNYAQQITVFGQLIEGFDVLDAITSAPLSGDEGSMRPKDEIVIRSVEIGKYTAE